MHGLGTRVADSCDVTARYFSEIDECVPLDIIESAQSFLDDL